MDASKVASVFAGIAGISMEEAMDQYALIKATVDEVESKLKPNVDKEKNDLILTYACAVFVYYRYILIECDTASIKTGDVSVASNVQEELKRISALKDEFSQIVQPLFEPTDFLFRQV
ncbi:MAG: hypothetical protein K0R90_572 [Oscillospiraceae bacterium]|jgi:hypothetical protein|nr:hypothetical protein [Oscillospiraceae bacterium]